MVTFRWLDWQLQRREMAVRACPDPEATARFIEAMLELPPGGVEILR